MLIVNGIKAWIVGLIVLVFIIAVLIVMLNIFLFLLPLIIILVIVGYLFRMLNRSKKDKPKKEYLDVKYKVKK